MAEVMDILAWNIYIGNKPDEILPRVEELLKQHNPEVAVLMEATRVVRQLPEYVDHINGLGYDVVQFKPRPLIPGNQPGQANIAILVRTDLDLIRRGALRMSKFWIGPKHGWPQDPRVYRWVKTRKVKKIWKVGGAHTPFGTAARTESRFRLVRWLKRALPTRPTVLVLDANMSMAEFRTTIATPGGVKWVGGSGIDLIAVKNAKLLSAKNLGKNGSDHPAMLYRVTA